MNHFWDLDGFMFDFDGHFEDLFGHHPKFYDGNKKTMWNMIYSVPNFFADLPLLPGAMAFYKEYEKKLRPMFLTSCPTSNYEEVARQKRVAVRKHFGYNTIMLPTNGSESKPLFMHRPGDVLIDDWGKNIRAWEAAGGVGIKHENFEQTATELEWLLHKNQYNYLGAVS